MFQHYPKPFQICPKAVQSCSAPVQVCVANVLHSGVPSLVWTMGIRALTDVEAILARAAAVSAARNPPTLARWMQRNNKALAAGFADGPPDWYALVVAMAEAGVTRRDGSAYAADTARKTWSRVKAQQAPKAKIVPTAPKAVPMVPGPTVEAATLQLPVVKAEAAAFPPRVIVFASPKTYDTGSDPGLRSQDMMPLPSRS